MNLDIFKKKFFAELSFVCQCNVACLMLFWRTNALIITNTKIYKTQQ